MRKNYILTPPRHLSVWYSTRSQSNPVWRITGILSYLKSCLPDYPTVYCENLLRAEAERLKWHYQVLLFKMVCSCAVLLSHLGLDLGSRSNVKGPSPHPQPEFPLNFLQLQAIPEDPGSLARRLRGWQGAWLHRTPALGGEAAAWGFNAF